MKSVESSESFSTTESISSGDKRGGGGHLATPLVLVGIVLLGLLIMACAEDVTPSPASSTGIDQVPTKPDGPGSATVIPSPTPEANLPSPLPTPNPTNSDWVKERLGAVIALYHVTDAGAALLHRLDVRQMRGEPGFFGSFGFKSWTGVGEAKPAQVMHELSHSYWGGFPVDRFPELGWAPLPGETLAPAMQRYHADTLSFLAQPPDDYEVFRQRLRNLPELSIANLGPLFHNVEADLVYSTGGNLALVPPILRKYWAHFLQEGSFSSWHEAVSWYQALSPGGRAAASKYLGFEHLDLRQYRSLSLSGGRAEVDQMRRQILIQEEQQRLFDLADQFHLLVGDPQKEENFQFWRGYLRDKLDLHRTHPDYLTSLRAPQAPDLAAALEFLSGLSGLSPTEQAKQIARQLPAQPFLVNFLPVLDNRTLMALFATGTPLPQGATLQATASFVERLGRFSVAVDRVLAQGRKGPQQGADQLRQVLEEIPFEPADNLRLFFELLRDADFATASQVVQSLDKNTIRRLMKPVPFDLRTLLAPEELLDKLDITASAEAASLKRGITLLMEEPSGNFIVDEPYLHQMYAVVAARSGTEASEMVQVLRDTPFPLEGLIQQQPQAAVAILSSDLEAAVKLVQASDLALFPPARVIYRLVYAEPDFAARMSLALEEVGDGGTMVESLAYLAYDKVRSEQAPELPISLESDGKFLEALLRQRGGAWLKQRLAEAFALFGDRAASSEVSPDFLSQYRATLETAVATLSDAANRKELQEIIGHLPSVRWLCYNGNHTSVGIQLVD